MLYDETKDYDSTKLWSSPNPTIVGGNIDPENLPQAMRDGRCLNLYPHQRLRVNTIFEVVHRHGQTACTDKHPAYDLVRGPSGKGLSVGYFPEIQSLDSQLPLDHPRSRPVPFLLPRASFDIANFNSLMKQRET